MSVNLERLKRSFGSVAELYDAVRPGYPQRVVERISDDFANLHSLNILEVGCGSGQATEMFARTGAQILATDLSAELIALARKRLAAFPNVDFIVSAFETLKPSQTFDLLISAQAFHWIPSEIGLRKAAQLLKPGGRIGLFWNFFRYQGDDVRQQLRSLIVKLVPLFARYPDASDEEFESFAHQWLNEINASGLYQDVFTETIWSEKKYTVAEYLALVSSYSWFQTQGTTVQASLLQELSHTIEFAGLDVNFPIRTLLIKAKHT